MTGNKITAPPIYIIRWSGSSLHAARNAERGGDSRQDADGYLNHHFPSVFFHHLLLFKRGSTFFKEISTIPAWGIRVIEFQYPGTLFLGG